MAHSNYTVTTHTSIETTGDSVFGGTLPNVVTLVITPDTGYVVSASSFSIGNPLPIEIASVTFSDTGSAGQPGNLVNVTVNLRGSLTMPANDLTLLIDIDGEAQRRLNPNRDISLCLNTFLPDESFTTALSTGTNYSGGTGGIAPLNFWPANIATGASPVVPGGSFPSERVSSGFFVETVQGPGITAVTTNDIAYTNPMNSLPGRAGTHTDQATKTQHTGTILPNTNVVLFEKYFWTPPEQAFEVTPYFEMNAAALNSGYYTIEETQDNFTVVKTLTQATTNGNIIHCDTTGIIPGMQLLTAINGPTNTTISCSGVPGGYNPNNLGQVTGNFCYPYFFADIRVASVDYINNTVSLTESNSWFLGDTVEFSSFAQITDGVFNSAPLVLCKKFTVKYNASTDNPCDNNHIINFQAYSNLWMPNSQPKMLEPQITNVDFPVSDISSKGETRFLIIETNSQLALFNVSVTDNAGRSYNFDDGEFRSAGNNTLTNQTAGSTNRLEIPIVFPVSGNVDTYYNVEVTPVTNNSNGQIDLTPTFASGVTGSFRDIISYSEKRTKITSDAGSSGVTIPSTLTDITVLNSDREITSGRDVTLTGNITKGSDILYVDAESITEFTNEAANGLESDIRVTFTGSGTTTIGTTVTGTITKSPTVDTTVTVDYGNHISQKPNATDVIFSVSKSRAITNGIIILRVNRKLTGGITVGSVIQKPAGVSNELDRADFDATFVAGIAPLPTVHKDFIVVDASSLQFGTLGSNGTTFNDNFFFGNSGGTQSSSTEVDQIVYKITDTSLFDEQVSAGETRETFTFKCNDGTTDSDTKTATINFTK